MPGRILFSFVLWLVALHATGQSAWELFIQSPALDGDVLDILELDEGSVLAVRYRSSEPNTASSAIIRLDTQGQEVGEALLWPAYAFTTCKRLLPRSGAGSFDCIAQAEDFNGRRFVSRLQLGEDLARIDSAELVVPDVDFVYLDEAVRMIGGGILAAGTSIPLGQPSTVTTQAFFAGFDAAGDSSYFSAYLNLFHAFIPRSLAEVAPGAFLITSTSGFIELDNAYSGASVTAFSMANGPVSGFRTPSWDGSGAEPLMTNSFGQMLELIPLSATSAVIGGSNLFGGNGTRAAVMKVDLATGEWQSVFLPVSGQPADQAALLKCMDRDTEGNLLFAFIGNYQSYPNAQLTLEPSRIHVYKLDTSLNLICSNVVDGFADSTYYQLQRIQHTSDGGFYLVGSRVDLSQPEIRFDAWARKFDIDDCFTAVPEPIERKGLIFPNPGTDCLHIVLPRLSSPVQLVLDDATGRTARSLRLSGDRVLLDTRDLKSGLYYYRVLDSAGAVLAAGRWIRE